MYHSVVIFLIRLCSIRSISFKFLNLLLIIGRYWWFIRNFLLLLSIHFQEWHPWTEHDTVRKDFLVIKADAYHVPTYVYLWDGMEWRAIPGQCPHPARVNNFIRFTQSFRSSLLRTNVVIGLLWGTRESTSFGIIASDESTTVRTILFDGNSYVYTYLAVVEYCGHSVADNVIQLNDYYCLRWDEHVSVSSVIDNS